MRNLFFIFAEFIKNEVLSMDDNKHFVLDCLKFNFKFLDSLDECVKCDWTNKLIIPTSDIKNWEVEYLEEILEENVTMYQVQRVEKLLNKIDK